MQYKCTIVINQALNNEYNAKEITTDLFEWVLIDHNQFFTLGKSYYSQNKEYTI